LIFYYIIWIYYCFYRFGFIKIDLVQWHVFDSYTTRKLSNKDGNNTLLNYSDIYRRNMMSLFLLVYRWKYFIGEYWGNYNWKLMNEKQKKIQIKILMEIILLVYYSDIYRQKMMLLFVSVYRWKYSIGEYWGNYSWKLKNEKQKNI